MSDTVDKGKVLIALARTAIAKRLGLGSELVSTEGKTWLEKPAATFVTLTLNGALRGCIGSLEAYRPLIEDVRGNAEAAAFQDSRFTPLTAEEFASVNVEVSVLTELEAMHAYTENIALSTLRPGIDGVVFKFGMYKATFLPQVWDQLPNPVDFLGHLKVKAGLSADFWHPEVLLFKYQVKKYREKDLSTERV
ncbi:hypothetical protein Ga0123462_0376 [Mariprofundus ferrinatatus]|uniref:AMMECR1 domain-containing protein n=1 Tax=Mariprofundus ferrinatatus TaxID=1921087 RepID=A0A2K8L5X6_9PROT|nr:AmmeMemoRadiSam system protein A [Mariprofundus ferrinatatus]ATX81251.1 hypothetical protein Ga0123462_0376 [Mariprofundus ferrinatatus]